MPIKVYSYRCKHCKTKFTRESDKAAKAAAIRCEALGTPEFVFKVGSEFMASTAALGASMDDIFSFLTSATDPRAKIFSPLAIFGTSGNPMKWRISENIIRGFTTRSGEPSYHYGLYKIRSGKKEMTVTQTQIQEAMEHYEQYVAFSKKKKK